MSTLRTNEVAMLDDIGKAGFTFDSVAQMKDATQISVGQKVRTLGYYAPGDGAGNDYEIVAAGTGSSYGFLYEQLAGSGLEAKLLGGGIMEDKTAFIPSDYATLQEAIDDLIKLRPTQGVTIDLMIESGHSPASGISVRNGDYSAFTVSSVDPVVLLAAGFGKSTSFIEGDNARMPTLNCLVDGNLGEAGFGYRAHNNSRGYVNPGCGAKYFWQDGLAARYASAVYAEGSIFSHNAQNGNTSSNIHALNSTIHADNAVATDSGYYGVQASSGGILGFRFGDSSRSVSYGIRARDQGSVDAESAVCNNCGNNAIQAFISGRVNFRLGQVIGSGGIGIAATRSSHVSANGATITSASTYGVFSAAASTVDVDQAEISGCGDSGIYCSSSSVSAFLAVIQNNLRGVEVDNSGSVNTSSATVTNNTASGVQASGASTVAAENSTIQGNLQAVTAFGGAVVDVTSANCESNTNRGIYAYDGGRITAKNTLCQKTPGTDAGGTSTSDIVCLGGAVISASGASGGVNKVVNSLNADGIIFR